MGGNAAKGGVPSCAHCVPMCLVCRSKAAGASRAASFRASHRCGVRGRLSSGQQGTRRGYRHRQKPLKAARWLGCRHADRHLRRLQTRPLLPTRGAAAIRRSSVGSRAVSSGMLQHRRVPLSWLSEGACDCEVFTKRLAVVVIAKGLPNSLLT